MGYDIIIIGNSSAGLEAINKASAELAVATGTTIENAKRSIEKALYSSDLQHEIRRIEEVSREASEIVKACADAFKYVPGKQKNGVKRKGRRNRFQANKFGQYE